MDDKIRNGKYLIGKTKRSDAFGTDYAACDQVLQQNMELRMLLPSGQVPEDFQKEAQLLFGHFEYAGMYGIRDYFVEDHTAYLVSADAEDGTLEEYLKKHRIVKDTVAADLLRPVLEALTVLHGQGLLHGNLTSKTLLMNSGGSIRLGGFSTSSQREGKRPADEYAVAPEVLLRPEISGPWSDVYSVCAVLYEMITGRKPAAAQKRMKKDILKKPSRFVPVDPGIEKALMKGLSLDVQNRFFSPESLLEALGLETERTKRAEDAIRRAFGLRWMEAAVQAPDLMYGKKKGIYFRTVRRCLLAAVGIAGAAAACIYLKNAFLENNPQFRIAQEMRADRAYVNAHPDVPIDSTTPGADEKFEFAKTHVMEKRGNEKNGYTYTLSEENYQKAAFPEMDALRYSIRKDTAEDLTGYLLGFENYRQAKKEEDGFSYSLSKSKDALGTIHVYSSDTETVRYSERESLAVTFDNYDKRVKDMTVTLYRDQAELFLTKVVPSVVPEAPIADSEAEQMLDDADDSPEDDFTAYLNMMCKLYYSYEEPTEEETEGWYYISLAPEF